MQGVRCAILLLFVLLGLLSVPSRALARGLFDPLAAYRNAPQISLLTFGPGEAAFLRFGHNAVRVRDPVKHTDLVYNFGTFRFDSPFLILDFLRGRFRYWLSVTAAGPTLERYKNANRDVHEQELSLGPQQAKEIAQRLLINARPEHREYVYDYYRDNCSTRIRDLLDDATDGMLRKYIKGPAQFTLREHTLRAVADNFWLYLGLDIAMGSSIDHRETRYEEMFLPEKLEEGLASISFQGAHGGYSLVKKQITHYESTRRDRIRRQPPDWTFNFFKAGATIAVFMGFLAWEASRRRQRWARALLTTLFGGLGLALGSLGTLFCLLWAFTNHEVAFHNENILQCAPWGLALVAYVPGIWRSSLRTIQRARRIAGSGLALSALGLILKPLQFMDQDNFRIIALMLPIWVGMFVALHLLQRRALRDEQRERRRATAHRPAPETESAPAEPSKAASADAPAGNSTP
jgi:hypothetical protein